MTRKLLFIVGPTAAGKSAVAHMAAPALGAEIVAMDSMTVYRGMDIGTAKPAPAERKRFHYHLIDAIDPEEYFSVGRYLALVKAALAGIDARGSTPLFVGGTPLYLRALTRGFFRGPPGDREIRDRLRAEAAETGAPVLHARLARIDAEAAGRIHPNDLRRIVRALEVYELVGMPISELQALSPALADGRGASMWGLEWSRERLYERIEARVDAMFEAGFIEEVRGLVERGALGPQSSKALGYAQAAEHLAGRLTLDEARKVTKLETRRFAKRQMTFFRTFPEIRWIEVTGQADLEAAAEIIINDQ